MLLTRGETDGEVDEKSKQRFRHSSVVSARESDGA